MTKKSFKNNFLTIPKLELHLHLEGATPISFIKNLSKRKKINISDIIDENGNYKFNNFNEFLKTYDKVSEILTKPEDFYELTNEVILNLIKDNVIYSEIFVCPDFCGNSDLIAWKEYFDAISIAIKQNEKKFGIITRIIPICIRHLGSEQSKKVAKCATKVDSDLIVGFGKAGDETFGSLINYKYSFDMAREAGLKLTCHAGEFRSYESVLDAINILEVDRIGHGVSSSTDLKTVETLREKKITLEICPKSNLFLGLYDSLNNHPINYFYEEKLNFVISTDDPTFFDISLSDEYQNLFNAFGWDDKFFQNLNLKGIDSIFSNDIIKKKLRDKF